MLFETINTDLDTSISLYKRAKYKWLYNFDIIQTFDNNAKKNKVDPKIWKEYALRPNSDNIWGGFTLNGKKIKGSSIIFILRDYLLNNYLAILKKYEKIILTRSDYYYLCKHPNFDVSNRQIYIPSGEDNGGICDRHIIFHPHDSYAVLGMLSTIIQGRNYNTESAVKETFEKYNCLDKIERFEQMMFTVGLPTDITTSDPLTVNFEETPNPNLKLKYPEEYKSAKNTLSKNTLSKNK